MFGDFAAADAFHEAAATAHTQHVQSLQGHRQTLTDVGAKAHYAAKGFTSMDQHNAGEMRAVLPVSGVATPRV